MPLFDLVPHVFIDSSQVRNIFDDPFAFGIRPGLSFARFRIFYEPLSVPYQPPDVEFVVGNAGPTLPVAIDGERAPSLNKPANSTSTSGVLVQLGDFNFAQKSQYPTCEKKCSAECGGSRSALAMTGKVIIEATKNPVDRAFCTKAQSLNCDSETGGEVPFLQPGELCDEQET